MVQPDPTGNFGLSEIDPALSTTDAAFAYARQGLRVTWLHTPVFADENLSCTCKNSDCGTSIGKHPILKNWQKIATSNVDTLRDQLSGLHVPKPNIGLVMGEQASGQYLIAIDIDSEDRYQELATEIGPLPETVESSSGRGRHLIFQAPPEVAPDNMKSDPVGDKPGVDAKVRNGQVVVAPSIHKSGKRYEWKRFGVFAQLPVSWALMLVKREIPKWIHKYTPQTIRQDAKAKKRAEMYLQVAVVEDCVALATCPEGLRNPTLYNRAISLFSLCNGLYLGAQWEYVHDELMRAAAACGLDKHEIHKTISSAEQTVRAKSLIRIPVALADPPSGTHSTAPPATTLSSDDPLSSIRLQDDRGSPAKTAGNVALLLAQHPAWRGGPTFDAYSQTEIWPLPIPTPLANIHRAEREIVDADHAAVQEWLMSLPTTHRVRVGRVEVCSGVHLAGARQSIDLLRQWVESLPVWDGTLRLDTWTSRYLGCVDSSYSRVTGRAWLVAAIERALWPGVLVDVAPVLEGPQRSGKNRALETLFSGGPAWAPWLCAVRGDTMDRPEYKRLACGRWILHDDEMRAREPKYLDAIKSWHSRMQETYRMPYAKEITVAMRRGLLVTSTNLKSYLHDDTGNRRWWPWETSRIDIGSLDKDRFQLLSEALSAVRKGERWRARITEDVYKDALSVADEKRVRDPLLEQVQKLIGVLWKKPTKEVPWLTTESVGTMLGYGVDKIDRSFETRLGAVMHELGYSRCRITEPDGSRPRVYVGQDGQRLVNLDR